MFVKCLWWCLTLVQLYETISFYTLCWRSGKGQIKNVSLTNALLSLYVLQCKSTFFKPPFGILLEKQRCIRTFYEDGKISWVHRLSGLFIYSNTQTFHDIYHVPMQSTLRVVKLQCLIQNIYSHYGGFSNICRSHFCCHILSPWQLFVSYTK